MCDLGYRDVIAAAAGAELAGAWVDGPSSMGRVTWTGLIHTRPDTL